MRKVTVTTEINAPAEVAWTPVTDGAIYPTWNPFITKLVGRLRRGGPAQADADDPRATRRTARRGYDQGTTNASTLTRWVPRLIMGLACGHTLFGLFVLPASLDPNPLAGIVDDGFVNAIDGNTDRAVTFWFLATGVVLFIVGHLTHWVVRRTGRIPALVGWWNLGLAVPSLVLLPTSPFWLALALGVLALVAARRDDQAAVELPTS